MVITDFDIGNYVQTVGEYVIVCYTDIEVITMSEMYGYSDSRKAEYTLISAITYKLLTST